MKNLLILVIALLWGPIVNGQALNKANDTTSTNFPAGWFQIREMGGNYYIRPKTGNTSRINLPAGGTTGQVLAKTSGANGAVAWTTPGAAANGLPTGGTTGQVLTKTSSTDFAASWQTVSAPASYTYIDDDYTYNSVVIKTADINDVNASISSTSNQLVAMLVTAPVSETITRVGFEVSGNGSGLTANGATLKNGIALLDANRNVLATANCQTAFATVGLKTVALSNNVVVTAGQQYTILFVSTGTTPAGLRGFANLSGLSIVNLDMSAAPIRYMQKNSTDIPLSGQVDLTTSWTARTGGRYWIGFLK
ncbi:hypothetical protein DYU11_18335 [Fibrisoma montanum]|uniref:Uncharacterized protein n=1 Tax=Fibrisoma montanum TaxID=2305895 RepID=A0A418M6I1_9BACT|nr:hypothetical protein [Fibrisoma montanum]RIV21365.1 hypothetical protein DYU11_18335 [Fibrisoma montanum]